MATVVAPRPVRIAASLVGVAGLVALAGCATTGSGATGSTADAPAASGGSTSAGSPSEGSSSDGASSDGSYTAGTYTADGAYQDGHGAPESISVTLTIDAAGTIEDVQVTGDPRSAESKQYQGLFASGIAAEVVGKPIDEVNVGIVSGSSLTGTGFNAAVEEIKAEAAS